MRRFAVIFTLLGAAAARADLAGPSQAAQVAATNGRAAAVAPDLADVAACGLLARFVTVKQESDDDLDARAARLARMDQHDPGRVVARVELLQHLRDAHFYWNALYTLARRAQTDPSLRAAITGPDPAPADPGDALDSVRALARMRDVADVKAKEWLKRSVREYVAFVEDGDDARGWDLENALFWLAELLIAQHREDLARPALDRLRAGFPRSRWLPYVDLLVGEIHLRAKEYGPARAALVGARAGDAAVRACALYRMVAADVAEGRPLDAAAGLRALLLDGANSPDLDVRQIAAAARRDFPSAAH